MNVIWILNKVMNTNVKSVNGNRASRSNLNIIHCNGGAKKWQHKILEIESLLAEKDPDMCYISEANLWNNVEPEDYNIEGYNIFSPIQWKI